MKGYGGNKNFNQRYSYNELNRGVPVFVQWLERLVKPLTPWQLTLWISGIGIALGILAVLPLVMAPLE